MTQQQQPEANGSTAESGRCPFRLRKLILQACLKHESLLIKSENIQDAHDRGGGNVADLADLLSGGIGRRITTDGISVSAPNANGDGGGELILLDRRAVSASSRQYDVLVRHLAALVAPNGGNRDRDRLAALFGSASAGDDAAAPLGKRVLQFFVGVANDLWNALDLDFVSPKDLVIGTQDAVCSSYLAAQCIMAILERAPGDGSAVLLHRRDDGENTFESFCREAAGLDASQLLRVVSTSSLNLILDTMVHAGLATLHCDGRVVAIGGPVDEKVLAPFVLDDRISKTESSINKLESECEALAEQARTAIKEKNKEKALRCMRDRRAKKLKIERAERTLENVSNQSGSLDEMKHNLEVIEALRLGLSAMQAQNRKMPVDSVETLMDGISGENEHTNEINEALQNLPASTLGADDEAACLAELEQLKQEIDMDKGIDAVASASIGDSKKVTEGDAKSNGAAEEVDAVVEKARDEGKQKKKIVAAL